MILYYLGIYIDEHLNYNVILKFLSESGGRALGAICSKFRSNKGFGFQSFSKLFDSGVIPILDYCSGVWGFGRNDKINTIQNRAIRFFMGVHKFSPNLAINADMGWISSSTRRKVNMIRLWNRFITMDESRLTKKIFSWDFSICNRNWSSEVYQILDSVNLAFNFVQRSQCNIDLIKNNLYTMDCNNWIHAVYASPKLRTYRLFKLSYGTENYLKEIYNRQHRSILAQLRCGILPLAIETGRYTNTPEEERLCQMCPSREVESECHFLFDCSKYSNVRQVYFQQISNSLANFEVFSNNEKLIVLMSDQFIKATAKFIHECYDLRQHSLYTEA